MRCPYCDHQDDRVVDSRSCRDGQAIRRRRECVNCEQRFTTYEYIEHAPLTIVKRAGNRAPFARGKGLGGRKAGAWESDNEKKERAAPPAIKSAAATYLQPTFERARQATLSRTGGDDLVHFRDFAP